MLKKGTFGMEPEEHVYGDKFYQAPYYVWKMYNFNIENNNYLSKPTFTPEYPVYKIGEQFKIYDNSYAINLETGKDVQLLTERCIPEEYGAEYTIVEEPYWDMVYEEAYGKYGSERFVTVQSSNTGNLYRVLCRESSDIFNFS